MPISLDASDPRPVYGQPPTPSSVGLPLQPFTPPGTFSVPVGQLDQFIRGFPLPPGASQVTQAVASLGGGLGDAFKRGVASGEVAAVLGAIAEGTVKALPALAGGVGAVLSLTGEAAAVLGPFAAAVPVVGDVASAVLEVYAPLAVAGGTTVKAAAGIAQAAALALQGAQAAAAAAAGAGGPLQPADVGRQPDPPAVIPDVNARQPMMP